MKPAASKSVSLTVRMPSHAAQRLDDEVHRLRSNPKWNLLTVNRNAVMRWALEHWLKTAPQSPAGMFLDDDHSTVDIEAGLEICAICSKAIVNSGDRTESVVLNKRSLFHTSCIDISRNGPMLKSSKRE